MAGTSLHGVSPSHLVKVRPVLERWADLMRRLAREWAPVRYGSKRDCPWWYHERTAVGFLSAAIWKTGGEAIEEYGTDKKKKLRSRRSERGYTQRGRGDLMFCVNKEWSKENSFVAEAKQTHPSLNATFKQLKRRVEDRLGKARNDSSRTRRYGYTRLGLLFLCPYTPNRGLTTTEVRDWIRNVIKVAEILRADLAWSFPRIAQDLSEEDPGDRKDYFYPGVALLVKPLRAPNKTK